MSKVQYMVSVDGRAAPLKIHTELSEARGEAERLAMENHNRHNTIRVLMLIDVLEPQFSHKWKGQE